MQKLTSFYSCFEEGWHDMWCRADDPKAATCLASSGVNQAVYAKCKSDKALIKTLQQDWNAAASHSRINSYPRVLINGKDASSDAQKPATLKLKLCAAGVKAACSSTIVV